jgi:WD40 repeat protein
MRSWNATAFLACLIGCFFVVPAVPQQSGSVVVNQTYSGPVTSVAFSPDGTLALTGGEDRSVRLWNAATGEFVRIFRGLNGGAVSVSFSPDGSKVIAGSMRASVMIWDAATGAVLQRFRGDAESGNMYPVFLPGGEEIVTWHFANVKLWKVATGKAFNAVKVSSPERPKSASGPIAVSADGARLVAEAYGGTVGLWDIETGELIRSFTGHTSFGVSHVAISPDRRRVLSGGYDSKAILWDAESGDVLFGFQLGTDFVSSVAFSPDGRSVMASVGNMIEIRDGTTGSLIRSLEGYAGPVAAASFSPDGSRVVAGGESGFMIWE